jgi:hypothetical protein
MSWLKQTTAGFALGLGALLLMAGVHSFHDRTVPEEERTSDGWAGLLLGISLTTWGSWTAWELRQQKQKREIDRLRSIFFCNLQHSSSITPLQLAMAADISGAEARQFLDEQAKEFAAEFHIDDRGGVSYHFNVGSLPSTQASIADPTQVEIRQNALPPNS